jgi:hypothetical protein
MKKIKQVFIGTTIDKEKGQELIAVLPMKGFSPPLLAATPEAMENMCATIQQLSNQIGVAFQVKVFTEGATIRTIKPDTNPDHGQEGGLTLAE